MCNIKQNYTENILEYIKVIKYKIYMKYPKKISLNALAVLHVFQRFGLLEFSVR